MHMLNTVPGIQKHSEKVSWDYSLIPKNNMYICKSLPKLPHGLELEKGPGLSSLWTQEPVGEGRMRTIQFTHSFNDYLWSACCVTVLSLNPRIQGWAEKTKAKHQTNKISSSESLHSIGGR
uniref:Uncharacterized protein n=1 Tax=Pipistrellus kuhlii TaxID=59472 RepID=A0A7J7VBM6_PIPKU|nr:hypothetical protein mPipKuh1_008510 [Pipistrellus kuhlii]